MDFLVDVAIRMLSDLHAVVFTPGDARYFYGDSVHFCLAISTNHNIT